MRQLLAIVLAKHIGQPLTVEVARSILAEVDRDCSIDVAQFGDEEFEGYLLQCERASDIEEELAPLHAAYAAERNPHLIGEPFPWDDLREAERAGTVLQATARHAATGALVGYMRVRVQRRLDAALLHLTDDQFYLAPEHRAVHLATHLWRFCERSAFALGVRGATIRTIGVTDAMARFFGYRKAATLHEKFAHEACDYTDAPTRHVTGAPDEPLAP